MTNPLGPFPLGEIVSFGLWMQKQGYRSSTIHYCIQAIKSVARRSNLLDPESAKTYIATANVTEARKAKLVEDVDRFYRWKHIPFEKPNYRRIERLPFVPLESEVDQLIAGVGKKAATPPSTDQSELKRESQKETALTILIIELDPKSSNERTDR